MRFEQDDVARQGYISERAKQIAKFTSRYPRSPIPPVGGGGSSSGGGSWWKGILGFAFLVIVMGTCIALMNRDDSDESKRSVPFNATQESRARATMTAVAPPTSKPTSRSSSRSTPRPVATPTAINEREHQMWLKRRGYVDTYIEIFTEWNSYVSDGELSNREMGLICAKRSTWERQLAEIRDYVRDFRELDPKTVNEPMNGLLTLEQDSIAAISLLRETPFCP